MFQQTSKEWEWGGSKDLQFEEGNDSTWPDNAKRHKIISIQAALSQQQNKPPLPLVIISLDITSWLVAITGSQRGWIVGVQSTRLPAIDKNATWRGRDTQHPGTQIHLLLANTYKVTFPNGSHWAQHCVTYVTFLSLRLHFFLCSNVPLTYLSKRNRYCLLFSLGSCFVWNIWRENLDDEVVKNVNLLVN